MPSPVPNHALGREGSKASRVSAKQTFLDAVRTNIIALAKAGQLASTLADRADQLNARGVRTTRGNILDAYKLSPALRTLGADANAIRGWLLKAQDAADAFDVADDLMVYQLWHEWLAYETHRWHQSQDMTKGWARFRPTFVHPSQWVEPWERRDRPDFYGMVTPPNARLVYALFGMFQISV